MTNDDPSAPGPERIVMAARPRRAVGIDQILLPRAGIARQARVEAGAGRRRP